MKLVFWLNCLLAAVFMLNAQDAPKAGPPTVRAQGEAVLKIKPDQISIEIGVVTQGQTAEAAAGQNAKQTTDVIATLKKELGTGADIQTSRYSIQPNYRQPRDGSNPPTIAGYTATSMVQVKSGDVAAAGKLIDAATRAGANNIYGIQFTLKDPQSVRSDALRQAVRTARANAEAMAAGLGMKAGRVVQVSDSEPVNVIPYRAEMMRAQAPMDASTPIEPGAVEIRAVVIVTAELLQ
jgi:uncharacterized protein